MIWKGASERCVIQDGHCYLVLDSSQLAQRLRGKVSRERVGVALHKRRLDARHCQQLRQLINVKITHTCKGDL